MDKIFGWVVNLIKFGIDKVEAWVLVVVLFMVGFVYFGLASTPRDARAQMCGYVDWIPVIGAHVCAEVDDSRVAKPTQAGPRRRR